MIKGLKLIPAEDVKVGMLMDWGSSTLVGWYPIVRIERVEPGTPMLEFYWNKGEQHKAAVDCRAKILVYIEEE